MALSVEADETALELFRRANRKPLRTGLAFLDEVSGRSSNPAKEKGVSRGDVVELYGPSGSGKSEVLINVVAKCVMPAWLGGEERTAVYFDNESPTALVAPLFQDGRLSILRLEQLLKGRITTNTTFQVKSASGGGFSSGGGATGDRGGGAASRSQQFESDVEAVLVGCLRRLRVIRPAGLFELLAAIEVLRFELEHRPALVVVDGMGSFFWQDKMAQSCGGEAVSMQGTVAKALVRLAMERPVVLFAAKSALFTPRWTNNNQTTAEHREYLPQVWQRAVTCRVLLQRRQKRQRPLQRPSPTPQGAGGGGGNGAGTLSLFAARVVSLNRTSGGFHTGGSGGDSGGGGSTFKGSSVAAEAGGAGARRGGSSSGGVDESRPYFFVVTDDGIHDVPAAATLGEGEGWEGR